MQHSCSKSGRVCDTSAADDKLPLFSVDATSTRQHLPPVGPTVQPASARRGRGAAAAPCPPARCPAWWRRRGQRLPARQSSPRWPQSAPCQRGPCIMKRKQRRMTAAKQVRRQLGRPKGRSMAQHRAMSERPCNNKHNQGWHGRQQRIRLADKPTTRSPKLCCHMGARAPATAAPRLLPRPRGAPRGQQAQHAPIGRAVARHVGGRLVRLHHIGAEAGQVEPPKVILKVDPLACTRKRSRARSCSTTCTTCIQGSEQQAMLAAQVETTHPRGQVAGKIAVRRCGGL